MFWPPKLTIRCSPSNWAPANRTVIPRMLGNLENWFCTTLSLCGWILNLTVHPLLVSEGLMNSSKSHGLQNISTVYFFIDFYSLIYKNERKFLPGPSRLHFLLHLLLFYFILLYHSFEDPLLLLICDSMLQFVASLELYVLVLIREQMNFLEFVRLESSCFLNICFTIDASFTDLEFLSTCFLVTLLILYTLMGSFFSFSCTNSEQ